MNIVKNNQNMKFNINSPKISISKQVIIPNIVPTEFIERVTLSNSNSNNKNSKRPKESKNINQDQLSQSPIVMSNVSKSKNKNINSKLLSSQTKSSERLGHSGSTYIIKHKDAEKLNQINKKQVEVKLKSRNMNNINGNINNLERERSMIVKQKTIDVNEKKYNHSPKKTPSPKENSHMNNDELYHHLPIIKKRAINNTRVINKGLNRYKEKGNLTSNMTINKSDFSSNNISNNSKSKSKSRIKDKSKSDASVSTSVNKSRSKSKKNRLLDNPTYIDSTNNFYSNNSKSPQSNNIIYNKKSSTSNYNHKTDNQKIAVNTPTTKKASLMIVHKKQSVSADKEEKKELFGDEYEEKGSIKNLNGSHHNQNQSNSNDHKNNLLTRNTIQNNKKLNSNKDIGRIKKNEEINESFKEIELIENRNENNFKEIGRNHDKINRNQNEIKKSDMKNEISNNLIRLNKNNKLDKEVLDEVLSEINNEIYSSKKTLSDKTDISDNNISILRTFEEIFGKEKKDEENFKFDYGNYSLSNNIKSGNSETLKDKIEKLKRLKNNHMNLNL